MTMTWGWPLAWPNNPATIILLLSSPAATAPLTSSHSADDLASYLTKETVSEMTSSLFSYPNLPTLLYCNPCVLPTFLLACLRPTPHLNTQFYPAFFTLGHYASHFSHFCIINFLISTGSIQVRHLQVIQFTIAFEKIAWEDSHVPPFGGVYTAVDW